MMRGEFSLQKAVRRDSAMKFTGVMLLILAAVLIAVLIITTSPGIQMWYAHYDNVLTRFENSVASIRYRSAILLVIFLLYYIKTYFPIISIPALCVLSGMVFPTFNALLVNVTGIFIMLTVKYRVGRSSGGGNARRLLSKNETSKFLIELDGDGNPWLLFVFRLIPAFPINPVSQIYGSMNFNFKKFIYISFLGLAPKIVSYTFIGHNMFHPLSWQFFVPIIILITISGGSVLGLNALINYFQKA